MTVAANTAIANRVPDGSEHWAFKAPTRPETPTVSEASWSRNPIDTFVLAVLDAESLSPSTEADRVALLRRMSLDVTGLPPSMDEVKRVLADDESTWYTNTVERLLASPHYGERWARHWLDGAQFADSDGFEKDKPRQVSAWRDWVIHALNDDMPYDQFVVEQVAGDLLPNATQSQRVATGFLRNNLLNEEGGADPEQFRMEGMFNRLDVLGRSVLGLTVGCAQCHTHKYDPITHTDYYRMFAYLNSTHEATMSVYSDAEDIQRRDIERAVAELEAAIKSERPTWREEMNAWAVAVRDREQPSWTPLEFEFDDSSAGGQKAIARGDGSYIFQGYAPTRHEPKMVAHSPLSTITAVRLELLTDNDLPRSGPGRSIYGAGTLSEFQLRTAPADALIKDYGNWTPISIASAVADVNPHVRTLGPEFPKDRDPAKAKDENRQTGPVAMAIDGKNETAWSTDIDPGRRNQPRVAIFALAEALTIDPETQLAVNLAQHHGGWNSDDNQNNNLGRFRISVTDSLSVPQEAIPAKVLAAASIPEENRSAGDEATLFSYWREQQPHFTETNAAINAQWAKYPQGDTQLVMMERAVARETRRLDRGDFLSPAEMVEPGTPEFLHPMKPSNDPPRLAFAKWLVDRDSPTAARAIVNRVWQHYFGQGLVSTSSDLGLQGETPTHPELLDWLSVEFMDSGWSVKHLHRIILNSATYRQVSEVTPDLYERDPRNQLMARGARFRVDGEIVRDIALAASGLLNPTVGGASVHPPAPEYLFVPPASYGPKTWNTDTDEQRYRRGLYTFRFRSVPYPVLQAFDTPAGNAPCTRRDVSNSPLQALATLNEPLFFECATALGALALAEGGETDQDRVSFVFQRCVTRAPSDSEIDTLAKFVERQRGRVIAGALNPSEIVAGSESDNPAELAVWTLLARVVLNLDETIVRQ